MPRYRAAVVRIKGKLYNWRASTLINIYTGNGRTQRIALQRLLGEVNRQHERLLEVIQNKIALVTMPTYRCRKKGR